MQKLKERIEIQVRNTNIHTEYVRDSHCQYDRSFDHRHSDHFLGGDKHRNYGVSEFRY